MSDHESQAAERVLRIFEDGKRFTEELLRENEKLRLLAARLRAEKADLENRFVKVDVPRLQDKLRLTEQEVQQLKEENRELRDQFEHVEVENREFADRYVQVERQYSDLIHLYVASHRLHSTLVYSEVIAIIKEIVSNMIGAEAFGIYLIAEAQGALVLVAHEELADVPASVPVGEGILGVVAASGGVYVAPADQPPPAGAPLACMPLKVQDRPVGVIAIYRFLCQKDGVEALDLELFELLGSHAATAIYAASLYYVSERKCATLEGFLQLLRTDSAAGQP